MSTVQNVVFWGSTALGLCLSPVVATVFGAIAIRLVLAGRFRALTILSVASVVTGAILTAASIATYWDLFGPGMLLALSSLATAGLAFLAIMGFGSVAIFRQRANYLMRQITALCLVGGFVIPGSHAAIGSSAFWFVSTCDSLNQRTAERIIPLMAQYKTDHGTYPKSLGEMVPQYLTRYPTSPCRHVNIYVRSYPADSDFMLFRCKDGEALLVVDQTYARARVNVYRTATQKWEFAEKVFEGCGMFY